MKFFNAKFLKRWEKLFFAFLAIICAVALWYIVTVQDRIEAQVDVGIDYYGIPANLVVTDGLISKITVRLRGPAKLLRSIPPERLNELIDLSTIKKGVTTVPLLGDKLSPAFRAFEVIDIQPPKIVVTADTMIERNVPVRPEIESPLQGSAFTVENVTVSPSIVKLRGPESIIAKETFIQVNVPIDPKKSKGEFDLSLALDTPSLVTAQPSTVKVRYTVTSGRTTISRSYPVTIVGATAQEYRISPKEIQVKADVPEALSQNNTYLNSLEATVEPPVLMEADEIRKVEVKFKLPEGMTLANPAGYEVTITRVKK